MPNPTTGPYGTPLLDNFNRGDGDPGANWTAYTGYAKVLIASQVLAAAGADKGARWNAIASVADSEVWANIGAIAPGAVGWLAARSTSDFRPQAGVSTGSGYTMIMSGSPSFNVYSQIGGVQTSLLPGGIGVALPALSYLALSAIGSHIAAWYWNGSTWSILWSGRDTAVSAAGSLGVALRSGSQGIDDFGGGEIALPDPVCCTFTPPAIGTLGLIVTIDATAEANDVGGLSIATFDGGSSPCSGDPVQEVNVARVPAGCKIIIDGAKHTVTLIDADGVESDGVEWLDLGDAGLDWLEVSQNCNYATCACVATAAPCTGGGSTLVSIDTQYRRL